MRVDNWTPKSARRCPISSPPEATSAESHHFRLSKLNFALSDLFFQLPAMLLWSLDGTERRPINRQLAKRFGFLPLPAIRANCRTPADQGSHQLIMSSSCVLNCLALSFSFIRLPSFNPAQPLPPRAVLLDPNQSYPLCPYNKPR